MESQWFDMMGARTIAAGAEGTVSMVIVDRPPAAHNTTCAEHLNAEGDYVAALKKPHVEGIEALECVFKVHLAK